MATLRQSRRVVRRHAIANADQARVVFSYPGPAGRRCELPLIDISVSGLSFRYRDEIQRLETGTSIPSVTVRFGACEIVGDLLVMHVTPLAPGETVCGALFYPAKDADLVKLKSVIAGIEAVTRE